MPRFLLADDHFKVRRHVRAALERQQGWVVCAEASNGREAVAKTAENKPDIAVLDLSMPELNGLEAAREIRVLFPETVVLILTMYNVETILHEARASGVRACLTKCNLQSLVDEVRNVLHENPQIANRGTKSVDGMIAQSDEQSKHLDAMLPGANLAASSPLLAE
jgi:DNA-binding NarL/FixJ family response regulator